MGASDESGEGSGVGEDFEGKKGGTEDNDRGRK